MTSSAKAPPIFKEGMSYAAWKHQLSCWEEITDLAEEKRAISVYLHSLEGSYKDVISKLPVNELKSNEGIKKILCLLDRYCDTKKSEKQYDTYSRLHNFKRTEGESIKDALIRFESVVCDLEGLEMKLPDAVLAFHVLNAMNIGEENMKLARATITDLTYEKMVAQIRSIVEKRSSHESSTFGEIKTEPEDTACAFYSKNQNYRGNSRGRGQFRGRVIRNWNTEERRCYKCGALDHLSYNCPRNRVNNSGGTGTVDRRCYKCNSPDHFSYACPNRTNRESRSKDVNIILLEEDNKIHSFIGETLGSAIVDSGAKSNVVGKTWLDNYIETLTSDEVSEIKEEHCLMKFRFGDGQEVESDTRITVPVTIGGKKQKLVTSVIMKDLPLLWSFDSLCRNGAIIDFGNLSMNLGNQVIPLKRTSTGHLLLPLSDKLQENINIVLQVRNLENLTSKEKERKMKKLHIQMAHASKESLIRLLRSSGINDKEMEIAVSKVVDSCDFCIKYKRKPLRPCVSEPLCEGFNNTVAMDLITYVKDKVYVLHIICLGTRYSAATVVRGKLAKTILKGVLNLWIHYFGSPRRFLTDNGGEFANEEFKTLCEKFNIVSITTPGESPWSNGVVERHNGLLMETVRKVIDECQCDLDTALPWAVCAKNTLSNVSGYSPNILVYGRNPNEPSILSDSVPALEPCTTSEFVKNNLSVRLAARKAFVAADSSERIRRALRMKLRTSNNIVVHNGDAVFYRRLNSSGWKGPGCIIGNEGKFVVVRHGGQIYRVPLCHVLPIDEANKLIGANPDEEGDRNETVNNSDMNNENLNNEAANNEVVNNEVVNNEVVNNEDVNNEVVNNEHDNNDVNNEVVNNEDDNNEDVNNESDGVNEESEESENEGEDCIKSDVLPKINSTVKFKTKENGGWQKANILSKGGKSGGKNEFYLNIKVQGEDKPKGVFWNRYVDIWKEDTDEEFIVLFSNENDELKPQVLEAKEHEISNWERNKVFVKVKDTGQKAISSRWVITEKQIPGSTEFKTKARIVCRGYEEDSSSFRTDSPTCTKESLRITLTSIVANKWECKSLDVRAAFLQGFAIDRTVYMKPPSDIRETGVLWKLQRCPYGLNDAPRSWFRRVSSELMKLKVSSSKFDEAMFYYRIGGKLSGIMVLHVDDFLFGGNRYFHEQVINKLLTVFEISVQNCVNFKYLGLELLQVRDGVLLDQDKYIQNINYIKVHHSRKGSELLSQDERNSLKRMCGKLLWVANNTRPDVCYEVSRLCNAGSNATVNEIRRMNKLISNMKQEKVVVKFPYLGCPEKWCLVVFSDSSFGNLPDGSSQGGYVVLLVNADGSSAPLSWQSKKLHRVTKSTLASETLAVIEAVDAAVLLRLQIQEIYGVIPDIFVYTDSKSLYQTVHTSHVLQDKSVRISVSYLRQFVKNKELKMCWTNSEYQLADTLTKFGASSHHLKEVMESAHL